MSCNYQANQIWQQRDDKNTRKYMISQASSIDSDAYSCPIRISAILPFPHNNSRYMKRWYSMLRFTGVWLHMSRKKKIFHEFLIRA
jgi:hypothetical protein